MHFLSILSLTGMAPLFIKFDVQVGTAKIGASAEEGVVDPQLRVYGIDGLRVMDASVFPKQMSGHPACIIIAMAYRAADIIQGKI
jgi:choline dehydrogenase